MEACVVWAVSAVQKGGGGGRGRVVAPCKPRCNHVSVCALLARDATQLARP